MSDRTNVTCGGVTQCTHRGNTKQTERTHSLPKVLLEVLSNLAHETLERQLAKKKLSALLVTTDLTQSNGTRPVAVGLLDTAHLRGGLTGGLGGQLLARGLATGALAGSLLGASHLRRDRRVDERANLKQRMSTRTAKSRADAKKKSEDRSTEYGRNARAVDKNTSVHNEIQVQHPRLQGGTVSAS